MQAAATFYGRAVAPIQNRRICLELQIINALQSWHACLSAFVCACADGSVHVCVCAACRHGSDSNRDSLRDRRPAVESGFVASVRSWQTHMRYSKSWEAVTWEFAILRFGVRGVVPSCMQVGLGVHLAGRLVRRRGPSGKRGSTPVSSKPRGGARCVPMAKKKGAQPGARTAEPATDASSEARRESGIVAGSQEGDRENILKVTMEHGKSTF